MELLALIERDLDRKWLTLNLVFDKYSLHSADVVRSVLPSIIPPSYKGATIRYMYYVRSTMSGQWLILENAHSRGESVKDFPEMVGLLDSF